MRAFSPGEELDNGVTQELQPLVVIDPGGGGGVEVRWRSSEGDQTYLGPGHTWRERGRPAPGGT